MEPLCRLHVIVPDEQPDSATYHPPETEEYLGSNERIGHLKELLRTEFRLVKRNQVEDDTMGESIGTAVSTGLFEERADNLDSIEAIQGELADAYQNASIFRSAIPRSKMKDSGYEGPPPRTVDEPATHIFLYVTNWGDTEMALSWSQETSTLNAPPATDDADIYHATSNDLISYDGESGEPRWQTSLEDIPRLIRAPVVGEGTVVGSAGLCLGGVDTTTGDIQWELMFDAPRETLTEHMIDSPAHIAGDYVGVGLRNGQFRVFHLETGDNRVLHTFDSTPVEVAPVGDQFLVGTDSKTVALLSLDGTVEWERQEEAGRIQDVAGEDGIVTWMVGETLRCAEQATGELTWSLTAAELPGDAIHHTCLSPPHVYVQTNRGLVALDVATGDVAWETPIIADEWDDAIDVRVNMVGPVDVADTVPVTVSESRTLPGTPTRYARNTLYRLDPDTGEVLTRFNLGLDEQYAPTHLGDHLLCQSDSTLSRLSPSQS